MFQLEGTQLRVCASYLREERNRAALRDVRVIVLEHILVTTEEFIQLLHDAGAEIFAILAKPYSIDVQVLKRMSQRKLRVIKKSYAELENTTFLDELLREALTESKRDGRRILIFEVGGYFASPLGRLTVKERDLIVGAIEDTTFGHNRYEELISSIHVPVISVARSRLKEIEADYVGRDAVQAVETVLRKLGVSLTGRHAVVIGYGMIGKNVARALKANDVNVSVYDVRDRRNLEAYMMGFNVDKKAELIHRADIVFAATGWSTSLAVRDPETGKAMRRPALSRNEILSPLKDNAILASIGSQDNEFDMIGLKELAVKSGKLMAPHVKKYKLPNDDNVVVIKDGTAVNFLHPSIPVEVLDLVFAEILLAGIFLIKTPGNYVPGEVHSVPEKSLSYIAKDWLRFANPKHR